MSFLVTDKLHERYLDRVANIMEQATILVRRRAYKRAFSIVAPLLQASRTQLGSVTRERACFHWSLFGTNRGLSGVSGGNAVLARAIFLLAVSLALSGCLEAPVSAQRQWVSDSFVNVRAAASNTAAAVDKLIINTPVTVVAKSDGFCEIVWGAQQRGFIACNLLTTKPVSLADVGTENLADGEPNPNYSPTRAFWLEPSYGRLLKAGMFFDMTMLPEKQRDLEEKSRDPKTGELPQIKRFPIPEFDAMCALLSKGIIVPKTLAVPPRPWDIKNTPLIHGSINLADPVFSWAYQQIKLPQAKPSYFKDANDIASLKVSADAISAQFEIPWSLQVTKPRYWSEAGVMGVGMVGAWDIGEVRQQLAQPVFSIAVDGAGRIMSAQSRMLETGMFGEDPSTCPRVKHIVWPKGNGIPAWPNGNELPPLLRLKTPLPFAQAKISVKKQTLVPPENLDQAVKFLRASMTGIDFDGDGSDDVAVWKAITLKYHELDLSYYESPLTLIFVNVQGNWLFLEFDYEPPEYCD